MSTLTVKIETREKLESNLKQFWGENFGSLTVFNSRLLRVAGEDRLSFGVLHEILEAIKLELKEPDREDLSKRVQDADEKRREGRVKTCRYLSKEGVRVFFSEFSGGKNSKDADVKALYKAMIQSNYNAEEEWQEANRSWRLVENVPARCVTM